ncbi:MAG: branched-chain amino acid ABC transporter permease [Oscillospiraceae bacterium]|nr:branched-chain amino acid ABC transporter permease [Oscillospiraceae bacterium]
MYLQQIVNGLTLGAIYALLALGYSMIFGVLYFINFAHGDIAMVGGYVTWFVAASLKMNFVLAIFAGIIVSTLLGVAIEFIGYRPIRRAPKLSAVIVSMGFSFVLSTSVQLIWGTRSLSMPIFTNVKTFNIGSIIINSKQIWILVIATVIMVLLTLLINKTKLGMAMRAVALDQSTSALMGVNVNRTISATFAIGSALGAMSGIMMAAYYGVIYSTLGGLIGTKGFAAVVLGGAGSIPGAMLGGMLIGIIESIAGTVFNAQVKDAVAFVVLILVLLFKPSGILGKDVMKD